jgi:hypothetical protein
MSCPFQSSSELAPKGSAVNCLQLPWRSPKAESAVNQMVSGFCRALANRAFVKNCWTRADSTNTGSA